MERFCRSACVCIWHGEKIAAKRKAHQNLIVSLYEKYGDESPESMAVYFAQISCGHFSFLDPQRYADAFQMAKAFKSQQRARDKAAKKSGKEAIKKWRATSGAASKAVLMKAIETSPNHDLLEKMLIPVPAKGINLFRFVGATGTSVKEAAAFLSKDKGNLEKSVKENYVQRNNPIMEPDCNPIEKQKDWEVTPCAAAGICLCSPSGRRLKRMTSRVMKVFKMQYKQKSTERKSAKDGFIVFGLVGTPVSDASGETTFRVALQGAHSHWFHLGFLCESPLRPTLLNLACSAVEGKAGSQVLQSEFPESIELDALEDELTQYEAIAKLDTSMRWYLQFYRLDDSNTILTEFVPGHVKALADRGSFCVWKHPKATRWHHGMLFSLVFLRQVFPLEMSLFIKHTLSCN